MEKASKSRNHADGAVEYGVRPAPVPAQLGAPRRVKRVALARQKTMPSRCQAARWAWALGWRVHLYAHEPTQALEVFRRLTPAMETWPTEGTAPEATQATLRNTSTRLGGYGLCRVLAGSQDKPHRYNEHLLVIIMIVMTQDNKPCGHVGEVDSAESSTTASLGEQLRCFEMFWDVLRAVEMF